MPTSYEVRVEGELQPLTLRRLGCGHCVAGAQTLIRIEATPEGLQAVLKECSDIGAIIEGVVRLDS